MPLKLGTRGSKLALAQSGWVANQLTSATGLPVELVVISTRGDRIIDRPLAAVGGKGLFTLELEEALRSGAIDLAVHSLKDLPVEDPDGLITACIPQREDPRDVIVGLATIEKGRPHRLGTGSPRRQAQLAQLFPGAQLVGIRGNIDTRVAKALAGEVDAVVLAQAGLNRLGGFEHLTKRVLEPSECLPAPGQGALAIQCVADRQSLVEDLASIRCSETTAATQLERMYLSHIGGGCHAAVGALALHRDDHWQLNVMHSLGVGHPCIYKEYLGATVENIKQNLLSDFSDIT